ncbi:MAG: DUF3748 domain-containing protein [Zavarzinella sp.]
MSSPTTTRQLTRKPCGHILTNTNVWSADGQWIYYDVRSDPAGSLFDGNRIERVHVKTGTVEQIFESRNGAHCGVVTAAPHQDQVVFIAGPEFPTSDWTYGAAHRQGMLVSVLPNDRCAEHLEARNLTTPFTPGALRGGTHVHTFHPTSPYVAFTYDDAVLPTTAPSGYEGDVNQRNVGVALLGKPVQVPDSHARNHSGSSFSVLVTRTVNQPAPGSDEICKAFEDAWVGTRGYVKTDGTLQHLAIAFQGEVVLENGQHIHELFISDLPTDLTVSGAGPIEGTATLRPHPPAGVVQRRLTYTHRLPFPGIQGPRHWVRSSPDGSRIAFLMKDRRGIVQLFVVSPNGGEIQQISQLKAPGVTSAFSWHPTGSWIAHASGTQLCCTHLDSGHTQIIPLGLSDHPPIRPEAVVFSPDGSQIAFVLQLTTHFGKYNQIFCAEWTNG